MAPKLVFVESKPLCGFQASGWHDYLGNSDVHWQAYLLFVSGLSINRSTLIDPL